MSAPLMTPPKNPPRPRELAGWTAVGVFFGFLWFFTGASLFGVTCIVGLILALWVDVQIKAARKAPHDQVS